MVDIYELTCSGCGTNHSRTDKLDELFCNECNEKKPMSLTSSPP